MTHFRFSIGRLEDNLASHSEPDQAHTLPMHTREWLLASASAYTSLDRAFVVRVSDEHDNRLAAIAFYRCPSNRVCLLGGIDQGESVGLAVVSKPMLAEVARYLVAMGEVLDLGHYPTSDGLLDELKHAAGGKGFVLSRRLPTRAMPCLELDQSWIDPLSKFSKRRRKVATRKIKKAGELGGVDLKVLSPTVDEVDELFAKAIEVESKSWKSRVGTALAQDSAQREFYRQYSRSVASLGDLRMCFLEVGGVAAATVIAVSWRNRFWALKTGYNEAYSAVSPGEMIFQRLISYATSEEYETFEFCGKEAAWTKLWTTLAQDIESLRFYPWNFNGIKLLLIDGLQLAYNRLKQRLKRRAT